jgi:hypothetical protein
MRILDEIPGLYRVIALDPFRKTEGVTFDLLPEELVSCTHSIDRVIHDREAVSPGPVGGVERPWYMHPAQSDNLLVMAGTRYVELYTPNHGKVEQFTVTRDRVMKGDQVLCEGSSMLVWPVNVFHRIVSGKEGSASLNFAEHHEGFDITTNFNIYDLDLDTGVYTVIRKGEADQDVKF